MILSLVFVSFGLYFQYNLLLKFGIDEAAQCSGSVVQTVGTNVQVRFCNPTTCLGNILNADNQMDESVHKVVIDLNDSTVGASVCIKATTPLFMNPAGLLDMYDCHFLHPNYHPKAMICADGSGTAAPPGNCPMFYNYGTFKTYTLYWCQNSGICGIRSLKDAALKPFVLDRYMNHNGECVQKCDVGTNYGSPYSPLVKEDPDNRICTNTCPQTIARNHIIYTNSASLNVNMYQCIADCLPPYLKLGTVPGSTVQNCVLCAAGQLPFRGTSPDDVDECVASAACIFQNKTWKTACRSNHAGTLDVTPKIVETCPSGTAGYMICEAPGSRTCPRFYKNAGGMYTCFHGSCQERITIEGLGKPFNTASGYVGFKSGAAIAIELEANGQCVTKCDSTTLINTITYATGKTFQNADRLLVDRQGFRCILPSDCKYYRMDTVGILATAQNVCLDRCVIPFVPATTLIGTAVLCGFCPAGQIPTRSTQACILQASCTHINKTAVLANLCTNDDAGTPLDYSAGVNTQCLGASALICERPGDSLYCPYFTWQSGQYVCQATTCESMSPPRHYLNGECVLDCSHNSTDGSAIPYFAAATNVSVCVPTCMNGFFAKIPTTYSNGNPIFTCIPRCELPLWISDDVTQFHNGLPQCMACDGGRFYDRFNRKCIPASDCEFRNITTAGVLQSLCTTAENGETFGFQPAFVTFCQAAATSLVAGGICEHPGIDGSDAINYYCPRYTRNAGGYYVCRLGACSAAGLLDSRHECVATCGSSSRSVEPFKNNDYLLLEENDNYCTPKCARGRFYIVKKSTITGSTLQNVCTDECQIPFSYDTSAAATIGGAFKCAPCPAGQNYITRVTQQCKNACDGVTLGGVSYTFENRTLASADLTARCTTKDLTNPAEPIVYAADVQVQCAALATIVCETKDDPDYCPKYILLSGTVFQCLSVCSPATSPLDSSNECSKSCPSVFYPGNMFVSGSTCVASCPKFHQLQEVTGGTPLKQLVCVESCEIPFVENKLVGATLLYPTYLPGRCELCNFFDSGITGIQVQRGGPLSTGSRERTCVSSCAYQNRSKSVEGLCEKNDSGVLHSYNTDVKTSCDAAMTPANAFVCEERNNATFCHWVVWDEGISAFLCSNSPCSTLEYEKLDSSGQCVRVCPGRMDATIPALQKNIFVNYEGTACSVDCGESGMYKEHTVLDVMQKQCTKTCNLPFLKFPLIQISNIVKCGMCQAPLYTDRLTKTCVSACQFRNYTWQKLCYVDESVVPHVSQNMNPYQMNLCLTSTSVFCEHEVDSLYCPRIIYEGIFGGQESFKCISANDSCRLQSRFENGPECTDTCPGVYNKASERVFVSDDGLTCVPTCPSYYRVEEIPLTKTQQKRCVSQCRLPFIVKDRDYDVQGVPNCDLCASTEFADRTTGSCLKSCQFVNETNSKICQLDDSGSDLGYSYWLTNYCLNSKTPVCEIQGSTFCPKWRRIPGQDGVIDLRLVKYKCMASCGSYLDYHNECLDACPFGTFADEQTGLCIDDCPAYKVLEDEIRTKYLECGPCPMPWAMEYDTRYSTAFKRCFQCSDSLLTSRATRNCVDSCYYINSTARVCELPGTDFCPYQLKITTDSVGEPVYECRLFCDIDLYTVQGTECIPIEHEMTSDYCSAFFSIRFSTCTPVCSSERIFIMDSRQYCIDCPTDTVAHLQSVQFVSCVPTCPYISYSGIDDVCSRKTCNEIEPQGAYGKWYECTESEAVFAKAVNQTVQTASAAQSASTASVTRLSTIQRPRRDKNTVGTNYAYENLRIVKAQAAETDVILLLENGTVFGWNLQKYNLALVDRTFNPDFSTPQHLRNTYGVIDIGVFAGPPSFTAPQLHTLYQNGTRQSNWLTEDYKLQRNEVVKSHVGFFSPATPINNSNSEWLLTNQRLMFRGCCESSICPMNKQATRYKTAGYVYGTWQEVSTTKMRFPFSLPSVDYMEAQNDSLVFYLTTGEIYAYGQNRHGRFCSDTYGPGLFKLPDAKKVQVEELGMVFSTNAKPDHVFYCGASLTQGGYFRAMNQTSPKEFELSVEPLKNWSPENRTVTGISGGVNGFLISTGYGGYVFGNCSALKAAGGCADVLNKTLSYQFAPGPVFRLKTTQQRAIFANEQGSLLYFKLPRAVPVVPPVDTQETVQEKKRQMGSITTPVYIGIGVFLVSGAIIFMLVKLLGSQRLKLEALLRLKAEQQNFVAPRLEDYRRELDAREGAEKTDADAGERARLSLKSGDVQRDAKPSEVVDVPVPAAKTAQPQEQAGASHISIPVIAPTQGLFHGAEKQQQEAQKLTAGLEPPKATDNVVNGPERKMPRAFAQEGPNPLEQYEAILETRPHAELQEFLPVVREKEVEDPAKKQKQLEIKSFADPYSNKLQGKEKRTGKLPDVQASQQQKE